MRRQQEESKIQQVIIKQVEQVIEELKKTYTADVDNASIDTLESLLNQPMLPIVSLEKIRTRLDSLAETENTPDLLLSEEESLRLDLMEKKLDQIESTFHFRPHFGWVGAIENNRQSLSA